MNRGSAPLFLERSRGVFLHAGPGEAAVCRVKLCPVGGCGQSAQIVDGANVDDRLSADDSARRGKRNGLHPRLAAVGRALDGRGADHSPSIERIRGRNRLARRTRLAQRRSSCRRCRRQAIRRDARRRHRRAAVAPAAVREARQAPRASAGGFIAWFARRVTRLVAKLEFSFRRAVLRSGCSGGSGTSSALRYRHPHGRRLACDSSAGAATGNVAGRFGTRTQMATAVAAAVSGASQRNTRAGVQAWRAGPPEPCAPSPPEPPCTAGSSTRALRPQPPPARCSVAIGPGRQRLGVKTGVGRRLRASAAVSCPASRCDPVRGPLVLSSYRTIPSRFLAGPSRTASARPYVEDLVQIRRANVLCRALETPRNLRVVQSTIAEQSCSTPSRMRSRVRASCRDVVASCSFNSLPVCANVNCCA